jgi:hypothetical protein
MNFLSDAMLLLSSRGEEHFAFINITKRFFCESLDIGSVDDVARGIVDFFDMQGELLEQAIREVVIEQRDFLEDVAFILIEDVLPECTREILQCIFLPFNGIEHAVLVNVSEVILDSQL